MIDCCDGSSVLRWCYNWAKCCCMHDYHHPGICKVGDYDGMCISQKDCPNDHGSVVEKRQNSSWSIDTRLPGIRQDSYWSDTRQPICQSEKPMIQCCVQVSCSDDKGFSGVCKSHGTDDSDGCPHGFWYQSSNCEEVTQGLKNVDRFECCVPSRPGDT